MGVAVSPTGESAAARGESGGRRVLVLARRTATPGGVVIFLQTAVRHLSPDWRVDWLVIGRRSHVRSRIVATLQPVLDAWRLFRTLRRARYHVVHVNPTLGRRSVFRDGLFMLVLRAARCRSVLVFFHGWDTALARTVCRVLPLRWLFRASFGAAAQILVLAPEFGRQLDAMGIDAARVAVTTTMFDGRLFDGLPTVCAERDRVCILFLARMAPDKGVDVLIAAFERIRQMFPRAELVLAGDGPMRDELLRSGEEKLRERGITLPGFVGGKEKARLLLDATVFVLPSRHAEGCPVAVLEAMAAGLPVVATRVGAVPVIIRDGVNGILLDQADPGQLADAMIRLLTDADLRASMAALNRELAWERYEASKVTAQLEARYREVSGT